MGLYDVLESAVGEDNKLVTVALFIVVNWLLDDYNAVLLSLKDFKHDALLLPQCFDDVKQFELVKSHHVVAKVRRQHHRKDDEVKSEDLTLVDGAEFDALQHQLCLCLLIK